MPAAAYPADLDQGHLQVGNTEQEVFVAGAVVAAAAAAAAAAADGPHHHVAAVEVVLAAEAVVGPAEVEAGCQENAAVGFAAVDPLLLVHVVVVVLAQDLVVPTVVEHTVREQVMSLYPAVADPCSVAIHWSL
jgi:hypothetical protein